MYSPVAAARPALAACGLVLRAVPDTNTTGKRPHCGATGGCAPPVASTTTTSIAGYVCAATDASASRSMGRPILRMITLTRAALPEGITIDSTGGDISFIPFSVYLTGRTMVAADQ